MSLNDAFSTILPAVATAVGGPMAGAATNLATTVGSQIMGGGSGSAPTSSLPDFSSISSALQNPQGISAGGSQGPSSIASTLQGPYSIAPGLLQGTFGGGSQFPRLPFNLSSVAPSPGPTQPIPQLPGPTQPTAQQPSPITSAIVSGTQAFDKQRQLALARTAANRPRAISPTIRPTPAVPVTFGTRLAARQTPLERYSLLLRSF